MDLDTSAHCLSKYTLYQPKNESLCKEALLWLCRYCSCSWSALETISIASRYYYPCSFVTLSSNLNFLGCLVNYKLYEDFYGPKIESPCKSCNYFNHWTDHPMKDLSVAVATSAIITPPSTPLATRVGSMTIRQKPDSWWIHSCPNPSLLVCSGCTPLVSKPREITLT